MTNVEARLKVKGKEYKILVDVDKAMQLKQGKPVSMQNVLASDRVFSDIKKGLHVKEAELMDAFGTEDINVIAEKIVRQGEILLTQEYREKAQENKIKQVIDFLSKNAMDPATEKPHTPERIERAIEQAGINIENKPVNEQMSRIISDLRKVLPIKIETKKLSVKVPAIHTGKVYSLLKEYKEKEEWLNNGDLLCVINLPAGMQMDFYDKLNSVTHGSAVVEEIKGK